MQHNLTRRGFIIGSLGVGSTFATPFASAFSVGGGGTSRLLVDTSRLIHAQAANVIPNAPDDQSATFQKLLDLSSEKDLPIFLPAGVYRVGELALPRRTRLIGVAGATRLTFNGRSHLALAERADLIHIDGVIFDGLGLPLTEKRPGLLSVNTVRDLRLTNCDFIASGLHGVDLTGAGGSIRQCRFSSLADTAIFAKQSHGLTITDNEIIGCGNGGILIHRFTPGSDGSVVSNNRIEDIKAQYGGTGQWGNGINVYQAHNVMVSNNQIADCAFSSVRVNASENIQITNNHCNHSGETALYAEFAFQGAAIADNIINGGTIGISLANFDVGGRLASVSGNIIRNLTNKLPYDNPGPFRPGVGIYAEADTVISSNVIENVPQAGIHVGWGEFCRNVIVSQNIIRAAPWGITASVVKGAQTVAIRDNLLSEISEQAITGFEWAKPVTDDLVDAKRTGYDHLIVSGNRLS